LDLRHPRYRAQFTAAGVRVEPRQGALRRQWRLQGVARAATPLEGVNLGAVRPHALRGPEGTLVRYLTEQYVLREGSLEQQFVLAEPLPLQGADLVVRGRIDSPGRFERTERGWRWRTDRGEVTLGEVTVFDATGARLPATLAVSATETRLTVDGPALTRAVYPVTLDPEIGANDFRISDLGPDGDVNFDAFSPAIAYNSANNEYLVAWAGDDVVDEEFEIFGQRIDAVTGAEIGANDFRISDMGPDGDVNFGASDSAIAYNSLDNEYLVVWEGGDDTAPLVDNEVEIFGQRIDAATGAEIGANDFRISDMGPDGDVNFRAVDPDIGYNSLRQRVPGGVGGGR